MDITALDSFSQVSQSRDSIYALIDTMCEDSTIAAVIETYTEDATEYNESGQIVWAESSNPKVQKMVQFLLDTMNIDKNIYKWVNSLVKYGDVYLRMYRESDVENDSLFQSKGKRGRKRSQLNEDVKVKAYSKNDHYINYLEATPNPAEIFELTRFGKSYAYIKAPVTSKVTTNMSGTQGASASSGYATSGFIGYKFNKKDVIVHSATDYVHACLEDNSSRTPEKVSIISSKNNEEGEEVESSYTVKRGQSLLYSTFKIWRELSLLENSVLLNRLTKSSVTRMINVEVGDMPKEMVGPHLQGIKALLEQKSSLNAGGGMGEYTNPGPAENSVYVPTHNGVGALTATTIGGDVDIKSIADIEYYRDKMFGNLKVPKQYFGFTDDGAGFNGGQSLSIISSRYAKTVKRIQNTIIQAITDAINLMLLDKGLDSYVNEFTLRMVSPVTQEEIEKRDNTTAKIQLTSDIMAMLENVEDTETKLKILKSLLSNILTNGEVIDYIQDEIDRLETEKAKLKEEEETPTEVTEEESIEVDDNLLLPSDTGTDNNNDVSDDVSSDTSDSTTTDSTIATDMGDESDEDGSSEMILPTPDDLGIDMTQNV